MDDILEKAETIANTPSIGPDEAAKFLSTYRIQAAQKLQTDISCLKDLVVIVTNQIRYLNDAQLSDKATAIAEWFIHTLHHLSESHPDCQIPKLQQVLRSSFAAFFRHYAKALRNVDRIEEMRLTMINSMDLSPEIPMSVVFLIHLYMPLLERSEIENIPAKRWISERFAECLAVLDFAGMHDSPFRDGLDKFQLTLHYPEKISEFSQYLSKLAKDNPSDMPLQTLFNLYQTINHNA